MAPFLYALTLPNINRFSIFGKVKAYKNRANILGHPVEREVSLFLFRSCRICSRRDHRIDDNDSSFGPCYRTAVPTSQRGWPIRKHKVWVKITVSIKIRLRVKIRANVRITPQAALHIQDSCSVTQLKICALLAVLFFHPFVGRRNEYQPKGGDALPLGSKDRYGSCVGGR